MIQGPITSKIFMNSAVGRTSVGHEVGLILLSRAVISSGVTSVKEDQLWNGARSETVLGQLDGGMLDLMSLVLLTK